MCACMYVCFYLFVCSESTTAVLAVSLPKSSRYTYMCMNVYLYVCICMCFFVGVQSTDNWRVGCIIAEIFQVYICVYVSMCMCVLVCVPSIDNWRVGCVIVEILQI